MLILIQLKNIFRNYELKYCFYCSDLQDQEHREWKDRFETCEKELSILREMLAREQEWRVVVEADCRKLKNDNQLLKNG